MSNTHSTENNTTNVISNKFAHWKERAFIVGADDQANQRQSAALIHIYDPGEDGIAHVQIPIHLDIDSTITASKEEPIFYGKHPATMYIFLLLAGENEYRKLYPDEDIPDDIRDIICKYREPALQHDRNSKPELYEVPSDTTHTTQHEG